MPAPSAPSFARPAAPRQPQDTGLPLLLLTELLLKSMLQHGLTQQQHLADHLKLAVPVLEPLLGLLRRELLIDLRPRGELNGDAVYQLTQAGRARAAEALARNGYCGATPVPLAAYAAHVQAQAAAELGALPHEPLAQQLATLAPCGVLREQLGVALGSRRAALLYGPSGAGKTYLCHRLAALLPGTVAVPYALEVGGEIVNVFDPYVHHALPETAVAGAAGEPRQRPDLRWVLCARPLVVTGTELMPAMLELAYDPHAGCYQAPPQLKANNGVLLVDDLGRQGVPARRLLHRWLVPMEQHQDQLALRNGSRFVVPFEVRLLLATHLRPEEVADEAVLRRIGQRVHVGALAPEDFRRLLHQACAAAGVACDARDCELLQALHAQHGRALLAGDAQDLATEIAELAAWHGADAVRDAALLRRAWQQRFLRQDD